MEAELVPLLRAMMASSIQHAGPPSAHSPAIKTSATRLGGCKKGHSYKPLNYKFRANGFTYRQVAREKDAAIYEQTWNASDNPSVCFEVIRIRCREGFAVGDRFIVPAEIYPNAEAWGVDGFTFSDKDAAFTKLREIC